MSEPRNRFRVHQDQCNAVGAALQPFFGERADYLMGVLMRSPETTMGIHAMGGFGRYRPSSTTR